MADFQQGLVLLDPGTSAADGGQPQSALRRRQRFLRVSVRGLLLLILVIGCGLGWIAWIARTGQAQRRAVAAIYLAGGWTLYDIDWEEGATTTTWRPRWPRSVVDHIGIDYFGNVVFINLHDRGNDELMTQVGRLTHLKQLHRPGLAVTDAGLAHLRHLHRLELLSLKNTQVTDAGLAHLKDIVGLRWLSVAGSRVNDAGVRELQRSLPHLQAIR